MLNELDDFWQLRLRRHDFSLSEEQELVRDTFAAALSKECPSERVRAAEAEGRGFDGRLWDRLVGMGVVSMGVPAPAGGDGAGLVELALVAEELGRVLAPAPFVEAVVAARLLARHAQAGAAWLTGALDGSRLVTLALRGPGPQLVPGAAVAHASAGLDGDELVLVEPRTSLRGPANLGTAPLASLDLAARAGAGERVVLAVGDEARASFSRARREWKLLTAAALVGLSEGVVRLGTQYATERHAFGVPIGAFQAVSHRLVDAAIAVAGARRLVWKAAWFEEREPATAPELVPMAFAHAAETAELATTVGVHVQGGFGVTVESDMQLYFRRAKAWPLVAGDPRAELTAIADLLAEGA